MSDRAKLGIVIVALVLLVPLWNFLTAGSAKVFKAATQPKRTHGHPPPEDTTTPAQLLSQLGTHRFGPEDAIVRVTVLMNLNNSCHTESVRGLKKLQEEYGDQVCVEFLDMADPEAAKLADVNKIGCEMGILVNGRGAFQLKNGRFVTFQGPIDSTHDYSLNDLKQVINMLIEKKTGHPPVLTSATPASSTSSGDTGTSSGSAD